MTPKKYFEQVFELEKKLKSAENERDAIMQTLTGAAPMEEAPTYSNQFNSNTENAAIELVMYTEKVNKRWSELVRLQIRISHEINTLPKWTHMMVLRERYLCSKKFEQIAVEQNYAYGSIIRFHGEALQEFRELYPDKFK